MPITIPRITSSERESFRSLSYADIAAQVMGTIIGDEIPSPILHDLAKMAYNFDVPLIKLKDFQYIMQLDKGPTASFKDFAARVMAQMMQYFLNQEQKKLVILTATSGDTGGAVADAFYNLKNVQVIVLYPETEISERQRRQMTTLGKNVTAIGIQGKFDDCQAMVKMAFSDPDLAKIPLSSANSINIGRLIPQMVYYFYAWSRIAQKADEKVIFSVPSGNFGDLLGGLLAFRMGLPVHKFIAVVNENDEFPKFLQTGVYRKISPSKNCISSAMNVGHPSNLARLIELYDGHMDENGKIDKMPKMDVLKQDIWALSISDEETKATIKNVFSELKYILEPHGAVGWAGLQGYLKEFPSERSAISFETADPAKFPDQISTLIGVNPPLPTSMQYQIDKEEFIKSIPLSYSQFKTFLQNNCM